MTNIISNYIVSGVGISVLLLIGIYVCEQILTKLLRLFRVFHRLTYFYKHQRKFEDYLKDKKMNG